MAAALHPSRNDVTKNPLYTRALINEFDFDDTRYPTLGAKSPTTRYQSSPNSADRSRELTSPDPQNSRVEDTADADMQSSRAVVDGTRLSLAWGAADQRSQPDPQYPQRSSSRQDRFPPTGFSPDQQSQEPPRSSLSYALPPGASRRVVERYSLDDNNNQPSSSRTSNDTRPTAPDSMQETVIGPRSPQGPNQTSRTNQPEERTTPNPAPTSSLRKSSSPAPNSAATSSGTTSQLPPIMSLSASPAYSPPIAPNYRAYAQQPTYVTQNNAPLQTYTPIIPPQEEVCVECAMRDQDMADVDVTSPGAWERASDAAFEELKQRELDEEANGVVIDNTSRPRVKGGRLTEQNVKLWLSINPREPTSRQQTLNAYIKSQRTLLEAEALAHARAMQEAKQLDNRMRDAYSQLRRSAYDMGSNASPADDLGGVRIKPPNSPHSPTWNQNHVRSNSREVTLLENGMIVEHVDVRREEKEARERKKKEERRARKSSKGSTMDVNSIISAQSGGPQAENGLKPYSRYSQTSSARPTSVLTAPLDRPDLPRAYSQASFSDVHSMGSASPRRTRFFGMRNLSAGWRSQESFAPSGISGSMVDMHIALQRENNGAVRQIASPIDLNTPRRSQIWPPTELEEMNEKSMSDEKSKKKKGGLAKIWRIVTGKNDDAAQREMTKRAEGNEDDLPLAPPPPLSYLVNRGPADGGMRHVSTPSLPSVVVSPKFGSPGMSPPTAPSSSLPSPTSLRRSGDIEIVDPNGHIDSADDIVYRSQNGTRQKSLHSAKSDTHLRPQSIPSLPPSPLPTSISNGLNPNAANTFNRPISLSREKSLPPLPSGEQPARILPSDLRPRTYYDHRTLPPGSGIPHDFLPPQAPFRTNDNRRQSFGGTSSRPNLAVHTMPTTKPVKFEPQRGSGARYNEFGASRQSLGRIDNVQDNLRSSSPLPSKRKSKFGLSTLLGKKSDKREQESSMQEKSGNQFPSMTYSPYDAQDDATTNGYTTSVSRHSTFSSNAPNNNMRMSVTSRKALEELVQQDAEFVAYRYPSNDQQLDLLR